MPEQPKPYNLEEEQPVFAGATADKQEKIESNNETLEKELSPEMIEMIMSRVKDIKELGSDTFVHNTWLAGLEHLYNMFVKGGGAQLCAWHIHKDGNLDEGTSWASIDVRKGRKNGSEVLKSDYDKVAKYKKLFEFQDYIIENDNRKGGINGRKILSEPELEYFKAHPLTSNDYNELRKQDMNTLRILKTNIQTFLEDSGWGFFRSYIGMIFENVRKEVEPQILWHKKEKHDSWDPILSGIVAFKPSKVLLKNLSQIILKHEDDSSLMVPIYALGGRLLWPKQMTHEEVKKFVEERDRKKEEEEEREK